MLRDLIATDEAALGSFFVENNRPEVTAIFHPFPLDAPNAHRICALQRKDRYFASFEDGAIVGFAMLRGWDEGFTTPSFGILVHHNHHGRGIGKALTDHAIALAREMKAPRIRLTVHRDNARAVRLYERAGFLAAGALDDGRLVMFAELHPA